MWSAREDRDGVVFDVLVTPRAGRERIGPVVDDRLKVAVTAPPVEGEANAAVCELLARALGVPRRAVEVVRGEGGRRKTVRVRGLGVDQVAARLC
jgi:uncharacterized protein